MKVADKKMLMIEMAREVGVIVDRWNNIKWTLDSGKQVRYNFKKNVIRTEIKHVNDGLGWTRLSSENISAINMDKWKVACGNLYDAQNI